MTKKKTTKPSSKATAKKPAKSASANAKTTKVVAKPVVKKAAPKASPKKAVSTGTVQKAEKSMGKRESSILLFMVILACLIFIGWNNPSKPFGFLHNEKANEGTTTGKALIGGEFVLVDQNGIKFSSEQLKGKKSLVFFGFTHCPSICPTSMAQITTAMEQLDPKEVQPVFISVDPERDTPEVIKAFLKDFDPNFVGLTGTLDELKNVKKAYKVYSSKVDEQNATEEVYMMDHSSLIYVMDKNGEYLTHFSGAETAEEMANKIKSY